MLLPRVLVWVGLNRGKDVKLGGELMTMWLRSQDEALTPNGPLRSGD